MKNLILLLIVTIFFSACSDSSLDIEEDAKLILKHNSKSYTLAQSVLDTESIALFNLDVKRVRVADSFSKTLFYEKVTTHNDYEFKYPSVETIQKIFKVKHLNVVYRSSSLLLVQLEREKYYINLIAETSSMHELSYVYGFNNREFFEVADTLGINANTLKMKNFQNINNFQSIWMQQELIIHPLAESTPGWGG